MRVERLHVDHYGPLAAFDADALAPFTVFHGPNERGKTLLIDAMIRLLLGRRLRAPLARGFGFGGRDMERVDERPEGFVVIGGDGESTKLGKEHSISDVSPVPISPEDFRNVFVVRDSDLTVREEDRYYAEVLERLTGLATSELERVLVQVQKHGRLRSTSPDSSLSNNADTNPPHAARNVENAVALLDDIRESIVHLRDIHFDDMFERGAQLRDELRSIEAQRDHLLEAERHQRFVRARAALDEVRQLDATLAGMQHLDRADLRRWQQLEVQKEQAAETEARERVRAEQFEHAISRDREQLERARCALRDGESRQTGFVGQLLPRCDAWEAAVAAHRGGLSLARIVRGLLGVSIIAGVAAGIGYAVVGASWLVATAMAAAGTAATAGIAEWVRHRRWSRVERAGAVLCRDAKRLGLNVSKADEIDDAIARSQRTVDHLRDELLDREQALNAQQGRYGSATEHIALAVAALGEIEAELNGLRTRTRCATLEALSEVITQWDAARGTRRARHDLLRGLIFDERNSGEDTIRTDRLAEQLDAYFARPETARIPLPDPVALVNAQNRIKEVATELEDIKQQLSGGRNELREFEVRCAQALAFQDRPRIRTVVELSHAAGTLQMWCERISADQRAAQTLVSSLQEIHTEERARMAELFGPAADVTRIFSDITNGRYRTVNVDPETSQVYVENDRGQHIPATSLSGGAYDQLYLAIRLSIAARLLHPHRGFFILDDPFLKADHERLARLMGVLTRFADDGWQMLYFTAKNEVVEAVREAIDAGQVRLVDLRSEGFSNVPPVAARSRAPEAASSGPTPPGETGSPPDQGRLFS